MWLLHLLGVTQNDMQGPATQATGACPAEGLQQQAAALQGQTTTEPPAEACRPTVMLKPGCNRQSTWLFVGSMGLQRYVQAAVMQIRCFDSACKGLLTTCAGAVSFSLCLAIKHVLPHDHT